MTVRTVAGAAGPPSGSYDADIIILALERPDETIAAIQSACRQTGIAAHIFVLDQGSCPGTLQRLAATAAGFCNVTLLATANNLGVAAGRTLISDMGHGRIVVALDNDAEFATPDTVARLARALDADPRVAAIGCRILSCDGNADDLSSWGYPAGLLTRAGDCFDAVTYVGAGHAIRRTAWTQAGGYDPALFFCWEEFDFCLRAIALGWRIRYRGDIAIRHKTAPGQRIAWTTRRWFYFVRNRLYIERKLGRNWIVLAPRIAGYLIKGVRNGLACETVRAIVATARMVLPGHSRPMPSDGWAYMAANDGAHRGSLLYRLSHEIFAGLRRVPDAAATTDR